jgi:hypothetical protein
LYTNIYPNTKMSTHKKTAALRKACTLTGQRPISTYSAHSAAGSRNCTHGTSHCGHSPRPHPAHPPRRASHACHAPHWHPSTPALRLFRAYPESPPVLAGHCFLLGRAHRRHPRRGFPAVHTCPWSLVRRVRQVYPAHPRYQKHRRSQPRPGCRKPPRGPCCLKDPCDPRHRQRPLGPASLQSLARPAAPAGLGVHADQYRRWRQASQGHQAGLAHHSCLCRNSRKSVS